VIDLLGDKYLEMVAAGKEVNYDYILPILVRLYDIEGVWFYSEDEQEPRLLRDHYYVFHKDSEIQFMASSILSLHCPVKLYWNQLSKSFIPMMRTKNQ